MRGTAERCLILGIGSLEGMTRIQLSAILAHEYGHFAHKDTAGGNMALQVSISMQEAAMGLIMNNLNKWYNPAWIFINSFHRIFLRVTHGASRLQEILADRYAAMSYGAKAFAEGLAHVVKQGIEFGFTADEEIGKAIKENRQPANLYSLSAPISGDTRKELDEQIEQALNHPLSAYDSHPPPKKRIEWVNNINVQVTDIVTDSSAWDLLPQRYSLEESMTRSVHENVLEQIKYQQEYERQLAEQEN